MLLPIGVFLFPKNKSYCCGNKERADPYRHISVADSAGRGLEFLTRRKSRSIWADHSGRINLGGLFMRDSTVLLFVLFGLFMITAAFTAVP
jgi:hypothetical protein